LTSLGLSLVVPHVVPCVGVLMGLAADESRITSPPGGICAGSTAIGVEHWPKPLDRLSLGWRRSREYAQIRSGFGRARSRRYSGSLQRPPQAVVLSRKLSNACRLKRACGHEQQSGCDRPGQVRSVHSFSQTHAVWLISYSVPRRLVAYCLPHQHAGRVTRTGPSASSTHFNRNFPCSRIRGRPWPENR
jgi:hypothetical protein